MNNLRRLAFVILLPWLLLPALANDSAAQELDSLKAMALTSKAFRRASDIIKPQLVTIESFGGVSAVQGKIGGIRNQGEGNTTGVLVSKEGHIVTSTFNFIQSPPIITVITGDGKRRVAKLLGKDEIRKLCILKIEPYPEIELPNFANLEKLTVGQWAISVGVGYGDVNPAVSSGIISAKNRIGGRAIQTDANISPANYGGPLLDIRGNLIGICVPLNPQSLSIGAGVEWYDSGIGFAVPLTGKDKFIERLKRGENIYPAFLGVKNPQPNREGRGLQLFEVVKDSPIEKAGLQATDIILKINSWEVDDLQGLRRIMYRFEAGNSVKLEYKRGDKEVTSVEVILGRYPRPEGEPPQLEPPKIR